MEEIVKAWVTTIFILPALFIFPLLTWGFLKDYWKYDKDPVFLLFGWLFANAAVVAFLFLIGSIRNLWELM